jgi:hypothetical protein
MCPKSLPIGAGDFSVSLRCCSTPLF